MSRGRSRKPRIPAQKNIREQPLKIETSGTTSGPNKSAGTVNIPLNDLDYEDAPPARKHSKWEDINLTMQKYGGIISIFAIISAVLGYFIYLKIDIGTIKQEVTNIKNKVVEISNKEDSNMSLIKNIETSIKNIEGNIEKKHEISQNILKEDNKQDLQKKITDK